MAVDWAVRIINMGDRRILWYGLTLFLVQGGAIRGRHEGDSDVHALPGDFFMFDAARASEVGFSRCQLIQLDIPRDRLRAMVGDVPAASRVTDALRVSMLATLLRAQLDLLPKILGGLECPREHVGAAGDGGACRDSYGRSVSGENRVERRRRRPGYACE
jgi:hypothetical protein